MIYKIMLEGDLACTVLSHFMLLMATIRLGNGSPTYGSNSSNLKEQEKNLPIKIMASCGPFHIFLKHL